MSRFVMMKNDFAKAVAKAEEMTKESFLEAILAERPDLQGKEYFFPHQGLCSHVVIIGDEVFKTARVDKEDQNADAHARRERIKTILRERDILKKLDSKQMPVPAV